MPLWKTSPLQVAYDLSDVMSMFCPVPYKAWDNTEHSTTSFLHLTHVDSKSGSTGNHKRLVGGANTSIHSQMFKACVSFQFTLTYSFLQKRRHKFQLLIARPPPARVASRECIPEKIQGRRPGAHSYGCPQPSHRYRAVGASARSH